MSRSLRVLAVAGALRQASTNRGLLRAAMALAPKGLSFDVFDLHGIPLYDGDVETQHGLPTSVVDLRRRIRAADALLIATPEYNYALPGVLKNAIDWTSRPTKDEPVHPFVDKPVGVISATGGRLGGPHAQTNLRQVAVLLNFHVMPHPEILIGSNYDGKFDMATGELKDPTALKFLGEYMQAFDRFARRLAQVPTGSA